MEFLGVQIGREGHICTRKQMKHTLNYCMEAQENLWAFQKQFKHMSSQHLHFICLKMDLLGSSQCWKGKAESRG